MPPWRDVCALIRYPYLLNAYTIARTPYYPLPPEHDHPNRREPPTPLPPEHDHQNRLTLYPPTKIAHPHPYPTSQKTEILRLGDGLGKLKAPR